MTRAPRLEEPLSFPTAARALGWKADSNGGFKLAGRRLRRMALRRERELGRQFAIRDSMGRPTRITLGALARYMPELRPSRMDTLAAQLRPLVAEFKAEVGALRERCDGLEREIRELRRDQQLVRRAGV